MYNLGSAAQGVNGETSCVAEHIQQFAPFGIFFEQGTVLSLVYKEAGLLSAKPVYVELKAILHRYVFGIAAHNISVVFVYVGFVGQCGVRFIVYVLYLVAKNGL